MTSIVFPGQGSQFIEMSKDFYDNFDTARRVFELIADTAKIDIKNIIFNNPADLLNQTQYTQLSIFCSSISIFKVLSEEIDIQKLNVSCMLGHSLGEYTALVASNTINIADASILIKKRGELMHTTIEPNTSGMAAIIGKNAGFIDEIIRTNNLDIVIANDNSPMQVVVSGLIGAINSAENIFSLNGVKRYVKLNVSAAFHSKYMSEAQNKLIGEIDKITFKNSNIPIISNYNANINSDLDEVIYSLKNQMANKVKWTESIKKLEGTDIDRIIEIGPSKVLSGLISRITKNFDIKSIDKIEDLKKFN